MAEQTGETQLITEQTGETQLSSSSSSTNKLLSKVKENWKEIIGYGFLVAIFITLIIFMVLAMSGYFNKSNFTNAWKIDETPLSWNLYSGDFNQPDYNKSLPRYN